MKQLLKKHLLKIQPYQTGKPIEEVKRELGLKSVIKLASNENPYGPPPLVLKAISRAAKDINRYPDGGCFHLRRELAKRLKVAPQQLIFGNGSDEIIVMSLRAFVSPRDEVIVAKPSFLVYSIASKVIGAKVREIPLKNFRNDLEAMADAVTARTRIIFIGNPDNPAGTYVTQQEIAAFLRKIPKDIFVFIDEAYHDYAVSNKDYPDTVKLLKKHKNLMVSRTFSKIFGLAGLRIGYGIAEDKIIDIFNRVREPFNVNSLAQAAALACLKEQKYYRWISEETERQRQYFYDELADMDMPFVRTATNFIQIDVGKDSTRIAGQLLSKGVIVRDMAHWGLNQYIRVSIGTEAENRRFIKALGSVIKEGTR